MADFGKLTVLGTDPTDERYRLCRCECGNEKRVRRDHLRTGKTISCGCERARLSSVRLRERGPHVKHGASKTRAYGTWLAIKQRCFNPRAFAYKDYGGRGITVCDRWLNFDNFLADMGQPGPGETIERIDNDAGYEPGNCRWATRREQQNNRRSNRRLTVKGETHTIAEWSRISGVHHNTLTQRIDAGLSPAEVLRPGRYRITHCKRGHLFDEANTYWFNGTRSCRACQKVRATTY
jgi:hypothetical protein